MTGEVERTTAREGESYSEWRKERCMDGDAERRITQEGGRAALPYIVGHRVQHRRLVAYSQGRAGWGGLGEGCGGG